MCIVLQDAARGQALEPPRRKSPCDNASDPLLCLSLETINGRMNAAYDQAMERLDDNGKVALQAEQQDWQQHRELR